MADTTRKDTRKDTDAQAGDTRKDLEDRIKNAVHQYQSIPIPGTTSQLKQVENAIKKDAQEVAASERGLGKMIESMNVSKSIADIGRRAKIIDGERRAVRTEQAIDGWQAAGRPGPHPAKSR